MIIDETPPAGFVGILVVMLGFFALHFFIARGAKARQPWARIVSLIIGLLMLFGFPVGTIIGIYLISASWSEWREPRVYSGSLTEGWPTAAPSERP
jgi:hypothetical protein